MKCAMHISATVKKFRFSLVTLFVMAVSSLLLCGSLYDPSSALARLTGGLHDSLFGGSFFSLFSPEGDASVYLARYAASPSAWLLALLPQHALCFAFLSFIRASLAALALFFFLRQTRKTAPMLALALSLSYGLIAMADTGALIAEQMILLPLLLTVTLRRLSGAGNTLPFSLLLFFSLITGAQLLFFNLLIYALFLLLEMARQEKKSLAYEACLLPALLATVCALPFVIFSFATLSFDGAFAFPGGTLIYRFPFLLLTFFGGTSLPGYTAVFAGVLALLLLPVFFFSTQIIRKEKLLYGGTLLALLLLFFFIEIFDGALGYAVTFLLLCTAARLFPEDAPALIGSRHAIVLGIGGIAFSLALFLLQIPEYRLPTDDGSTTVLGTISAVYLPILIIILTGIALSAFCDEKHEGLASRGILILLVALSAFDGFLFTHYRTSGEFNIPAYTRKTEDERIDALIEDKKPSELLLYDHSLSAIADERNPHFDLLPSDTRDFLSLFGVESFDELLEHPALLALFSPSGVVTKDAFSSPLYLKSAFDSDLALYTTVSLPLVYTADKALLSFEPDDLSATDALNALYTAMLPESPPIASVERLTFTANANGGLGYASSAGEDLHLYLLPNAPSYAYYEIVGSKKSFSSHTLQSGKCYFLGSYRTDNAVTLDLVAREEGGVLSSLSLVSVSDAALSGTLQALNAHACTDEKQGEDFLECTVAVEDGNIIMTALPYRDGLSVTLDGKEACTESVCGFLAIRAESGTHTLRIEDETKELALPLLLLFPSLALLTLYGTLDDRRKKPESR